MKAVIIGGVAAGMSAASKLARMQPDAQVTVYEMGETVSYGACGLPYYVSGISEDPAKMLIRTVEDFQRQGIDVRIKQEVLRVSPKDKTVLVRSHADGSMFTDRYDCLLVATGAGTVRPLPPGADCAGVHALKTYADGIALRKAVEGAGRVAVIGGGYIGVEVAESLREAGKSVLLFEAAPHILTPFDPEIRSVLTQRMTSAGIDIHTEDPLVEILPDEMGRARAVRVRSGEYPADLVVLALGVRPATRFLANTGIRMLGNGAIEVDRSMRSSIPDIYAAGDCASVYSRIEERGTYIALGTVANKCGRIAGENMAGGKAVFDGCLGSSAISVCGLEAARTGLGEAAARELYADISTTVIQSNDRPPYYPNPTPLLVKLICEKRSRRILGGQIVGEKGAVLRVDALVVAITAGMTAPELGMTDFCYAPPFAGVWDALNIAGNAVK